MYRQQRSYNQSLREGATDAKYHKTRPDTTTDAMNARGNSLMLRNRLDLNDRNGYGNISAEATSPVVPAE